MTLHLACDLILVTGLMVAGAWLEGIGPSPGSGNLIDRFFAPLPLGLCGLVLIFLERGMA